MNVTTPDDDPRWVRAYTMGRDRSKSPSAGGTAWAGRSVGHSARDGRVDSSRVVDSSRRRRRGRTDVFFRRRE